MARPGFWIDTLLNVSVTGVVQQDVDMMGIASFSESRRGWTLVRTIIGIDVAYAVHDSGEGSHLVTLGIGIASTEALSAAGGIAEPDVAAEHPQAGWLFRAQYRIFGFAADQPQFHTARIDKDIRAKRKLANGICVFSAASALHEGAASTVKVTGIVRQYWLDA